MTSIHLLDRRFASSDGRAHPAMVESRSNVNINLVAHLSRTWKRLKISAAPLDILYHY